MKKIINFINRTREQLCLALYTLKMRYKKVLIHFHYYNGWWWGWFEVEKRINKLKTI
jgi:hypothetical protein